MRPQRPRIELDLPITLDRTKKTSLEEQLLCQVRQAILLGQLSAGMRLPSTRSLAASLGISRTTTFAVYDRLLAEGYLSGKPGSGTFVSSDLQPRQPAIPTSVSKGAPRWLRHTSLHIRDEGPLQAETISFRPGATFLPRTSQIQWQTTWKRMASVSLPTDYTNPQGEMALRVPLSTYLGRARGVICTPEDILITTGATEAIDLIARATLTPGALVGIEEPGYAKARQIFLSHGARLLPLIVDQDGIRVDQLPTGNAAPVLIYVTPSHQYPLGSRLSTSRRLALLEWARTNDVLIIEDDYDSEFRFDTPPLPALASLDTSRPVVYLGTFSKILTPAIRCGYLVAAQPLQDRLTQIKMLTEFHTSWPLQQAIANFLTEGHLERHIRRMRQHYAQCRVALHMTLGQTSHIAPLQGIEAGLHAYLALPSYLDEQQILSLVRKKGVVVYPLRDFFAGTPNRQGLVLGYGGLQKGEIIAGATRLADVIALAANETRADK
ncbi:PLP-dependent aminotransferase family protein [Ktedonosporobacter rubrisoli]|nr:PLP-dependent aminotransferase family protein [Ktedonosporobacter rubrisoli]